MRVDEVGLCTSSRYHLETALLANAETHNAIRQRIQRIRRQHLDLDLNLNLKPDLLQTPTTSTSTYAYNLPPTTSTLPREKHRSDA